MLSALEIVSETILDLNMYLRRFFRALSRKKVITAASLTDTKLARCLSTLDLTALGIGSTLGVGVYVLAGEVAMHTAGPAVIISFLIAAIASIFAGLCYAEFGARVPKAGSAYVYSYVCVGEFIAFIIGWNLLLEYIIGSASVVKGLSKYFDVLLGYKMENYFTSTMPMHVDSLAPYPDFFAFGVTLVFSTALAFGAKESSLFNNIFTLVNLTVVVFVIIAGSIKAHTANWTLPASEIPPGFGNGGFAPYGVTGIIKGAAICFYGFIGFDCVATAGEEAKSPQKSIPIAVVASLLIVFLSYFGVSTVLTMVLPYFDQDPNAPLPYIFEQVGWEIPKYIVGVGAMAGLCSSLLGAMFPLPRIIYAMACDGLLFGFMGKIHPKFQTPLIGTLAAGLLTGFMAMIFDLDQLVSMMSIGTLLAYSMVAACVLILRYEEGKSDKKDEDNRNVTPGDFIRQIFNIKLKNSTSITSQLVTILVAIYVVWCFGLAGIFVLWGDEVLRGEPWALVLVAIFGSLLFITLLAIQTQPTSGAKLTFSVPLVPWIPGLSMLINVYLMLMLDVMTWIRFGVWIIIGLIIYFSYGIFHSTERKLHIDIASISNKSDSPLTISNPFNDISRDAKYVPKAINFS